MKEKKSTKCVLTLGGKMHRFCPAEIKPQKRKRREAIKALSFVHANPTESTRYGKLPAGWNNTPRDASRLQRRAIRPFASRGVCSLDLRVEFIGEWRGGRSWWPRKRGRRAFAGFNDVRDTLVRHDGDDFHAIARDRVLGRGISFLIGRKRPIRNGPVSLWDFSVLRKYLVSSLRVVEREWKVTRGLARFQSSLSFYLAFLAFLLWQRLVFYPSFLSNC